MKLSNELLLISVGVVGLIFGINDALRSKDIEGSSTYSRWTWRGTTIGTVVVSAIAMFIGLYQLLA